MENFDFSKQEDQEKFGQLPQEEKDKIVEQAHSEALNENYWRNIKDLQKREDEFKERYKKDDEIYLGRVDMMCSVFEGTWPIVQIIKNNIEKGEYDTLISDEVTARIPTLV